MPTLRNRERDTDDYRDTQSDDREISLGTGTILAIFFALALVCAVFFGLGYSMGRKTAQPVQTAAVAGVPPAPSSSIFSGLKPSASKSAGSSHAASAIKSDPADEDAQPPADPDATIVTRVVKPSDEDVIATPKQTAQSRPSTGVQAPGTVRQPKNSATPPAGTVAMPEITPNGTSMVQVAAVSHQEDADVLISALKKRGYAVFVRQEPQDHLLHVQVGPFATKKDADVMRQRLLSDGYNAIVK